MGESRCFIGLKGFPTAFQRVFRLFSQYFKHISQLFHWGLVFCGCIKGVIWVSLRCHKSVARVFHGCLKVVLLVNQGCFMGFEGVSNCVLMVFQGIFTSVPRLFLGCLKVFENISVMI